MERQGLVGAMPLGERWRAQGCIDGATKYLGTYDTEEEAHAVFMREKERVASERAREAEAEVDRILAGPTYIYEGGKGRGASLNGLKFKIVEAYGPHQAVAVPLDDAGVPAFANQTKVSLAYLTLVPEPPTTQVVEREPDVERRVWDHPKSATVPEAPTTGIQDDVLRFATRTNHHDVMWAVEFAKRHAVGKAAHTLSVLLGEAGIERQLEWLRMNTSLSGEHIRAVEVRVTSGLFMDDTARAAVRVLHKEYPDAFEEPDAELVALFGEDAEDEEE